MMISNAIALALLSEAGFFMVYRRLPRALRRWMQKHALLSDIIALVGVYYLFGGTLTALLAGALCGIMTSMLLEVANNKDKYLYIYDLMDFVKKQFNDINQSLNAYGQAYKAKQITE